MVALQDPALLLGGLSGLDLMMKQPDPVTGARIRALGDDFELGDPEAVIASAVSQWQDGDLERVDRYGNREAKIPLVIDAPGSSSSGDALAQMAARLDAACTFDGWTELVYVSPLAGSAPSVFEITTATVSAGIDDLAEITQGCRYVTLTLHARPFARTTDPVTIDAPAQTGSTTVTVDDGTSVTGWSMVSTAPPVLTNQFTNPTFVAANTGGWTAGANTYQVYRDTSPDQPWLTASCYGAPGNWYADGPLLTAISGERLDVVLRVRLGFSNSAGGTTLPAGIMARFYNSSSAQIGPDVTKAFTVTANWATVIGGWTAPAGAVSARVFVYANNPNDPIARWLEIDDTATAATYFDGATADTAALAYAWTGTANASRSTRTWTAPTLAVASGAVRGTVYGRTSAEISRVNTGIDAAAMATLPYLRIKGTATPGTSIDLGDGGDYGAVTAMSYSMDGAGNWEALVYRPDGFTTLDVKTARSGSVSTTSGIVVAVDSVEITDDPFESGKVQVRQVEVYGSQRTELSLSVLGLDDAGTTPVGLGEQVLVHTAAAGDDGRAKFLACRAASSLPGTVDSAAVSGAYNTLNTTGSPTAFAFPASTLLPGNYLVVARLRPTTAGNKTISFRGLVTPTVGDAAYDPATGGWKTAPLTVAATGWPAVASGSYVLLPLGLLRLPPADLEDAGATISVQLAASTASAVNVDDVFLLNADVGQASLLPTGLTSGSYSAVRLDAATVDSPQATAWVGAANGTMLADPARWIGEQHAAAPGLLQIATVTPGCSTSRVSAHYYPRYHTHVVDLSALLAA